MPGSAINEHAEWATDARWRAPGRVNLIGEHTDYNGGFCMPLAITPECRATVTVLPDPVVEVTSAQRPAPVETLLAKLTPGSFGDSWAAYPLGVVWVFRELGYDVPGLAIDIDSTVPIGAGLASSAAVTCAVASALNDLLRTDLMTDQVAAIARQAENDFVGVPTGGMDQLVAMRGRTRHVLLCDMRSGEIEAIPFEPEAEGLTLFVVDTGIRHVLMDGQYGDRRAECSEAARRIGVTTLSELTLDDLDDLEVRLDTNLFRRVRHVVTENERTLAAADLIRAQQFRQLGSLMLASHNSLREDFDVSVPALDLTVQILLAFGAHGARLTGAGFGGSVVGLLRRQQARAAATAIEGAFAGRGYPTPVCFTVSPANGASPAGLEGPESLPETVGADL